MRIRSIKPDFFHDDRLAELPALARLLFAGLWCCADSEGRLEDRPKRIKVDCLPYDDCDVDGLLGDLEKGGFILRYEVDGERYILVRNFLKHQRISGKEATAKSSIPPPPKSGKQRGSNGEALGQLQGSSGEGAVALEGKGREGKGREEALAGADAPPAVDDKASVPGPADLLRLWNELKPAACAKASTLSDQRKAAAAARIREHQPDPLGWWRGILAAVNGSALLRGEKNEWRADFDWLLKPANLLKVQEGKYADHAPRTRPAAEATIGKPVETLSKCELCGKDTPSLVWGHPCCTACKAVAFERAKALGLAKGIGPYSQATFDAAFKEATS